MLRPDNKEFDVAAIGDPDDITIGDLLGFASNHAGKQLVFHYDGHPVHGGYHVTEVKAGQFAALDCGANHEAWTEIFIQLWDIDEDGRTHMQAGKFVAIIRKVTEHLALDHTAKLTFEVSDGERPMQMYRASLPTIDGDMIRVDLSARPASCKPRDRWLEEQKQLSASCCGGSTDTQPCCST